MNTPVHKRVALLELGPNHCRFPLGTPGEATFGFCGKRKEVGPYCMEHALTCYTHTERVPRRWAATEETAPEVVQ
jgi:GcrA cell cycle regulator